MSQKDKIDPEVELELDGKVRKLKFNHLSLFSIEETEGPNFVKEAIAEIGGGSLGLRNLIVLLWGCLLSEMPDLDVRKEDDLRMSRRKIASWIVDFKAREAATVAVLKAISNSTVAPRSEDSQSESSSKKEKVVETGSAS
jgi:hypothetical protein